jgi:hypothetical protein
MRGGRFSEPWTGAVERQGAGLSSGEGRECAASAGAGGEGRGQWIGTRPMGVEVSE